MQKIIGLVDGGSFAPPSTSFPGSIGSELATGPFQLQCYHGSLRSSSLLAAGKMLSFDAANVLMYCSWEYMGIWEWFETHHIRCFWE